jgi:hypothetical protein
MQLTIDIKNESIAHKIIQLLEVFKNDGVEIRHTDSNKLTTKIQKQEADLSDEYIEKNWRKIGMNTNSADLDDDERIYEAAEEFYDDKHSS